MARLEEIVALLDKIRAKMPNAVFRTSLITGLPGETVNMAGWRRPAARSWTRPSSRWCG